ncbi:hypothetical protein DFR29_121112 [Tahibacter aquaticus]|uniref:Antitoxin Xre/MbcA/ParS-like toxin-binding domain-containing protein n=1 Tax=Tahibacter aquaticus TaxID=520092 RepID=A0A4R6YMB9_9GAMM|nr:hypothetical protein [Tahibacter aquaticus]TDR38440.1 hypothetical protein DFR29_121112 [Tahibacter aquaticus]
MNESGDSDDRARGGRTSVFHTARRRREQLLARGWPTAQDLAELLTGHGLTPDVAALRESGALLGAWSAADRAFVYPDCQFDREGHLLSAIRPLLTMLPAGGDPGGWRRVFWLYGPRDALDGQTPAHWLSRDPDRVLALAQLEFGVPAPRT